VAGILLGPSLFGQLSPDLYALVFASAPAHGLSLLAEIGLVLLMFQIGLEFDASHLAVRKNQSLAISVALTGLALPFALGVGLAVWTHPLLAPTQPLVGYALFVGIALAVTAVPVLARMLTDLGMEGLLLSRIALAWLLLAVAIAVVRADAFVVTFVIKLGLLLAYVLACRYLLGPALLRVLGWLGRQRGAVPSPMAVMMVLALLSGMATSGLGFHSAFGGLLMGMILSANQALVQQWKTEVSGFVSLCLLPLFFALAGSRAQLGFIASWSQASWFLIFLAMAVLGKFGGCYLAARGGGFNHQQARLVGVLMNTRGLMELVILSIGLEMGLISPAVYSILLLMAIVTTAMTVPLVRRWLPGAMAAPVHAPAKATGEDLQTP
jgi:Kef-type K+ transport system membrane component KefB